MHATHIYKEGWVSVPKSRQSQIIMECPRLVACRYNYLIEIEIYSSKGYQIVYLDETPYDSHNAVRKLWSDSSIQCAVSDQPSRGKSVVIFYTGRNERFANGARLLISM